MWQIGVNLTYTYLSVYADMAENVFDKSSNMLLLSLSKQLVLINRIILSFTRASWANGLVNKKKGNMI